MRPNLAKSPCRRQIDLIGFPMDLGADRRGVDMGPSALRIAGMRERLTALGYQVTDLGDIPVLIQERQKVVNPRLKYLKEIVRTSELLAKKVRRSLQQGHFPICLGGDHSMALGALAGVAAHCRTHHRRVGVIWIDAHTDMNTHETTPSGNIHGMPLAAALGLGHPDLCQVGGFTPKVMAEHCALIGVREIDALERLNVPVHEMMVFTMADIDRQGIYAVTQSVLATLTARVDHLHVSFDLDSVDPLVAPGVGSPVPGGLSYRETHLLMETIAQCGCLGSLEVAEVNPILDRRNQSAEFAVGVIASSMGKQIL